MPFFYRILKYPWISDWIMLVSIFKQHVMYDCWTLAYVCNKLAIIPLFYSEFTPHILGLANRVTAITSVYINNVLHMAVDLWPVQQNSCDLMNLTLDGCWFKSVLVQRIECVGEGSKKKFSILIHVWNALEQGVWSIDCYNKTLSIASNNNNNTSTIRVGLMQ